jgi:hypothetical protein
VAAASRTFTFLAGRLSPERFPESDLESLVISNTQYESLQAANRQSRGDAWQRRARSSSTLRKRSHDFFCMFGIVTFRAGASLRGMRRADTSDTEPGGSPSGLIHQATPSRWAIFAGAACKLWKKIGRGEWIRTTGLLVPKQTAQPNSLITE